MTSKHMRSESSSKLALNDAVLITRIHDLLKHCTGKSVKFGEKLPFLNGAVHVIVPGRLPLERIQRIAADTLELETMECGQLYRHPWIALTKYDRTLALTELHNWYERGWIFAAVYERWKPIIASGTTEEIDVVDAEMHNAGRIFWSLDEILAGSKRIGSTTINLQARMQTGRCVLNFLVPHGGASVQVRLEVRSHGSSSSGSFFY